MSADTRRAPKSSLAAAKASAVPWGLTVPRPSASSAAATPQGQRGPSAGGKAPGVPANTRSASNTHSASNTRSVTNSRSASNTRGAGNTRSAQKLATTQARSIGERRFTMALLAGAVGLTLALAAVGARVTVISASSKERMDGTLGRASLEQMEFRAANQRFALWAELAARGATLPDDLEVVATNASSSHWFLKVRDRRTGIACSRIGQLLDAPEAVVVPNCDRPSN